MLLDKKIPFSYVLDKVKWDLALIVLLGSAIHLIKQRFHYLLPEIPIAIPAFIGTAISVILSFKLNQSYDRWWEARKIWGAIVNDSRTLILQCQAFLRDLPADVRTIGLRHIAWCHSLARALRQQDALHGMEGLLAPGEVAEVRAHANKPLAILQLSSRHVAHLRQAGHLDTFDHMQLISTFASLNNWMGMAERIKGTVFPVTYRMFLHLFIYLFAITLSISMEHIPIYFELPLLMVIASSFFLLEKSAKHLQDPFSNRPTDTAMTAIATTIEINIKQLLGEKDVPTPSTPKDFYLM